MSWWVYLEAADTDPDEDGYGHTVAVDSHSEGGTYLVGGTDQAELNVTYNYGSHFRFDELNGKTGAESEPGLAEAVANLGRNRDSDYWAATPGNAGHAASILLDWARKHPTAVWRVS